MIRTVLACGVLALSAGTSVAQQTTRVSVDSSGSEANGGSNGFSISTDGLLVVFSSDATNLVANDTNGTTDVFVHDRSSGVTERVSVDSNGAQGNDWTVGGMISADGRIVAFVSGASNLVASDTNGHFDVFVHDRLTGLTERVSVDSAGNEGDDDSYGTLDLSSDGRWIAFQSGATNLVPGDNNGKFDVFVRDRVAGTTERVSVDSAGNEGDDYSARPSISGDGRFVAFDGHATNLVAGDTNLCGDVFVRDRSSGTTERVSVDSSGAQTLAGDSYQASLSADGLVVAFASDASSLVALDTNSDRDEFVHDRSTGATERVSVDSAGNEADRTTWGGFLSPDGRFVVLYSVATNLVPGDTNGSEDGFVHDRKTGATERVTVDSAGDELSRGGGPGEITDGGRFVVFSTASADAVANDQNGVVDVFVRERPGIASWSNYGVGFPGTNGVPSFTSGADPVLGSTLTVDVANSYGKPTVGVLLLGLQRVALDLGSGGQLLVLPVVAAVCSFSFGFDSFSGTIPADPALNGVALDLQVLEADPGAAKGVSATAGLELVLGY